MVVRTASSLSAETRLQAIGAVLVALWLLALLVGPALGLLIALYALAKLLELGDEVVFHGTGELVSGHSLKHMVAALAAWPVWQAMRQNARAAGLMRATA